MHRRSVSDFHGPPHGGLPQTEQGLTQPQQFGPEALRPWPQRPAPHRPEPDSSWRASLAERLNGLRERARTRRAISGIAQDLGGRHSKDNRAAPDLIAMGRNAPPDLPPATSPLVLAAIAVGAALCALGALWAWQTWSTRSSEPIDQLLPLLTVEGTAGEEFAPTDSAGSDATTRSAEVPPEASGQSQLPATVPPGAGSTPNAIAKPEAIIVHISGAVAQPGVVEISSDARVYEAVDMAGGATRTADLDRVNLAAPMIDGERIHVPEQGEEVAPALVHEGGSTQNELLGAGEPIVIDLNIASAAELESLPGIGPSIASAIVQTRLDRGPFLSVEELLEVPGVGEAKLALISPFVTIAG